MLLLPGTCRALVLTAAAAAAGLSLGARAEPPLGGGDSLQQAQQQLQQCRSVLKPLQDGVHLLERKVETCEEGVAREEKRYAALEEKVRLDMNELEDLRLRTRKAEDGVADVETDASKLRQRLDRLQRNNTALVQLGKQYRTRQKHVTSDLDNALSLLEYERTGGAEAKELLASREAEVAELQAGALAQRNSALQTQLDAARTALADAELHVDRLGDVGGELSAQTAAREAAEAALQAKAAALETVSERAEALDAAGQELSGKNAALSTALLDKTTELAAARTQLAAVADEKSSAEVRASEMHVSQRAAVQESERLKLMFAEYKEKVDDPALVDYFMKKAEWLQNPHVEGVDTAYEKTLRLLGPKLQPTQVALLEMQALLQQSSERLSSAAVGDDSELSPLVSGMLTYGILLLPLGLSMCLLVRLKRCISLAKATMLMALYNTLFCAVLGATSLLLLDGKEPLGVFRELHEEAFEFLQILMPLYYAVFLLFSLLLAVQFSLALRCKCSLRAPLLVVLPLVVLYDYYGHVWLRAMRDQAPALVTEAWAVYAAVFLVQFALVTCCAPGGAGAGAASLGVLGDPKKRHGHQVERERRSKEELEDGHVINVAAKVLDVDDVADSLVEGAERVKDKAQTIAESIHTGRSIEDIEAGKRKSKKKKKRGRRGASKFVEPSPQHAQEHANDDDDDDDDDDLENRKVD